MRWSMWWEVSLLTHWKCTLQEIQSKNSFQDLGRRKERFILSLLKVVVDKGFEVNVLLRTMLMRTKYKCSKFAGAGLYNETYIGIGTSSHSFHYRGNVVCSSHAIKRPYLSTMAISYWCNRHDKNLTIRGNASHISVLQRNLLQQWEMEHLVCKAQCPVYMSILSIKYNVYEIMLADATKTESFTQEMYLCINPYVRFSLYFTWGWPLLITICLPGLSPAEPRQVAVMSFMLTNSNAALQTRPSSTRPCNL